MSSRPDPLPLGLGAGDLFAFAHANGAIYLARGDGRSMLVTEPDLHLAARAARAGGGRVVVGQESGALADTVLAGLVAVVPGVEPVETSGSAHVWSEGSDALMEAARDGADAIFDDLLARGADATRTDWSGSSAVHYAARGGNLHALAALDARGADLDLVNHRGFTPAMVASASDQQAAVAALADLGAEVGAVPGGVHRFRWGHVVLLRLWVLPVVFTLVLALARPPWWMWLVLACYLAATVAVLPPRTALAGGAPARLEGDHLRLRRAWAGTRDLDLRQVTCAGSGGATGDRGRHRGRYLLLGPPEGVPVDRRKLQRLGVPADEVEDLLAWAPKLVVVAVDGLHPEDALLPIGNWLTARRVPLFGVLRAELERLRSARDQVPPPERN